jgi:GNAT superfamily N-acetyltransferase
VVEDVVVQESARGLGLGSELLRAVERWGLERGATRLQLLADRDNSAGLEFYDHLGWSRTRLICLRRHAAFEDAPQGEHA